MPQLRDYQRVLRNEAESGLQASNARLMLQLPTGGGKTVIAGDILARRLKADADASAVWLTHRVELAEQTCGMLRNAGVSAESRPNWTSGDDAPRIDNGVAILMAQTVGRREPTWTGYGEQDLLVVDEAHHATAESWQKAIQWWPGPALGMTATPWRLSVKEGFDHLFDGLLTGPQVRELQGENYLCQARALAPDEADTILGGKIDDTGDYNVSGINQANKFRPGVLTTGVLRFWQKHAEGRQTVVYAVSVGHANNLAREFTKAGVSTGVIHTRTPKGERGKAVESFRDGSLTVLINVAIATEGFDLPDASCVVLARPTLSLALYLQMVGRGLRPKPESNRFRDCLILDLAGNAVRHGLPEDEREWFLEARGDAGIGQGWTVYCQECNGVSPASSHYCRNCDTPFGKDCQRCGKWRAWGWWMYETHCGSRHAPVCDLCHYDVHIQLAGDISGETRRLGEMHQLMEAQIKELEAQIRRMDGLLEDEGALDLEFDSYLAQIPNRPSGHSAINREFSAWKRRLQTGRDKYRLQLSRIESGNADGLEILENIHQGLRAVLPQRDDLPQITGAAGQGELAEASDAGGTLRLTTWVNAPQSLQVASLQPPIGSAIPVASPDGILLAVVEWLIRQGYVSREDCPIPQSANAKVRCLINVEPRHLKGAKSASSFAAPVKLSNGLYLETDFDDPVERCEYLLHRFGFNPYEFRVNLADNQDGSFALSAGWEYWHDDDVVWDSWEVESIAAPTGQVVADDGSPGVLVWLTEWLIGQGKLQARHCPLMAPGARTRYLVNDKPVHRNGKNFTAPEKLSNGMYLEKAQNDMGYRWAELLEHCGQDPSQFRVNLMETQDDDDDYWWVS